MKIFPPTLLKFWIGAAAWAGVSFILFTSPAKSLEPMMDNDLFRETRVAASNLARDGFFAESVQTQEKAYNLAQAQWGPLHPSLAPLLKDLGILYHTLGNFKKAEEKYRWGLSLVEKNKGLDDPAAADYLDRLAFLYLDLDRLAEAEISAKKSLALRQADPKGDPQAVIQTLGLLGRIESRLENNGQAQAFLKQALTLAEKKPQSDAGSIICLLETLSQSYLSEKNTSTAQAALERALGVAQRAFPADSAEVADSMAALADFFRSQNQKDKADPLYTSALQINRRFVGAVYNYASLPHLKRQARMDFATGNLKDAEFLWEKSIQVEKRVFGASHPKVALDLIHYADVERTLGQRVKAQKALKEALGILKTAFPEDNPWVQLVQKRLK